MILKNVFLNPWICWPSPSGSFQKSFNKVKMVAMELAEEFLRKDISD
jgi:hypothetical protein